MKRRLLHALLVLVTLIALLVLFVGRPMAETGCGYAAKIVCSGVFVGGRDPAAVIAEDLAFVPWVEVEVDRARRAATARIGTVSRVAVHREGLGAVLVLPGGPDLLALRADALAPRDPRLLEAWAAKRWPVGDAGIAPAEDAALLGIDAAKLAGALDKSFAEPDPARKTLGTRALVVLYKGRVVAERYAPGFGPETPLLGWSMSKSVLHALIGIRIGEGRLSLAQKGLLAEWRTPGDPRAEITLDQLLRMSSGLSFDERYHVPWADAVRMLFRTPDAAAYAAAKPLAATPDGAWSYSSGTSNILSRVLRESFAGDDLAYLAYPRERLFDRIGMRGAVVETDPAGNFVWSSFTYATARDWARFGLLCAQGGVFAGRRVLPEGWVARGTRPTPLAPQGKYGAHFWLNAGTAGHPEDRPMPNVPADAFHASGFQEQHVMVVPSREAVIVRLGLTVPPAEMNIGGLAASVLEALPAAAPERP